MKEHIERTYKAFENSMRLGITALLAVNRSLDFNALKKSLGATDGNLSSNLTYLLNEKFIAVNKQFINNKPNSAYNITEAGRKAFKEHIAALEQIISPGKKK